MLKEHLHIISSLFSPFPTKKRLMDVFTSLGCNCSLDRAGDLIVRRGEKPAEALLVLPLFSSSLLVSRVEKGGRLKAQPVGAQKPYGWDGLKVALEPTGNKGLAYYEGKRLKQDGSFDNISIDVLPSEGCAEVQVGDLIHPAEEAHFFGTNLFSASSLSTYASSIALILLLLKNPELSVCAAFINREFSIKNDTHPIANMFHPKITVIVTPSNSQDDFGKNVNGINSNLGKGPAVQIVDEYSVADFDLLKRITTLTQKKNIPIQTCKSTEGVLRIDDILRKQGHQVVRFSIPCRYADAPVSVIDMTDAEASANLLATIINEYGNEEKVDEI